MVNQYSFLWRREDGNIWVVNASLTCKDEAHAQNDWENKSFTVLKNRVNIDKTEFIVYRSTRVKVNYSKIQCNYCSKVLKVYESLQDLVQETLTGSSTVQVILICLSLSVIKASPRLCMCKECKNEFGS